MQNNNLKDDFGGINLLLYQSVSSGRQGFVFQCWWKGTVYPLSKLSDNLYVSALSI